MFDGQRLIQIGQFQVWTYSNQILHDTIGQPIKITVEQMILNSVFNPFVWPLQDQFK
jgi:hypothetical protein